MEVGDLVTYTTPTGTEFSAKVIQEVGSGVLISYVEAGKPLATVDKVSTDTLTKTGQTNQYNV
jgi:hypothetical protein